jgi:hypothetical protein
MISELCFGNCLVGKSPSLKKQRVNFAIPIWLFKWKQTPQVSEGFDSGSNRMEAYRVSLAEKNEKVLLSKSSPHSARVQSSVTLMYLVSVFTLDLSGTKVIQKVTSSGYFTDTYEMEKRTLHFIRAPYRKHGSYSKQVPRPKRALCPRWPSISKQYYSLIDCIDPWKPSSYSWLGYRPWVVGLPIYFLYLKCFDVKLESSKSHTPITSALRALPE